jgi:succinate dehydrogenase/fumarate reductase flavoprotein subunit
LFYQDLLRAGLGLNNPVLARILAEQAQEALDWSRTAIGVEYLERLEIFGGHSVARCYTARGRSGNSILRPLLKKALGLGVQVRYGTRLEKLLADTEGRVVGALVRDGYDHRDPAAGAELTIAARRGVVLASGGFGADVAFRMQQDRRLTADVDTTNKPFTTAEALTEALRLGAVAVDLSYLQLGAWASSDEKGYGEAPGFADYTIFPLGIVVDPATGERFCDEMADRKTLADAMLAVGHPCVGLADSAAVSRAGWSLDRGLDKKVIRKFESLDALADHYAVGSGKLATPPYYAVRLWPKVHYTVGGLAINADAAVVDSRGKPLGGLFAAGEVAGGVHGACRLGSCSITECFVFGRIAGRSAAGYKIMV